jgi:hypothetical protein
MAGNPFGARRLPLTRMFQGASGTVFILLCLMYFIEYVDRVNLSAAASDIKAEFHLSNTKLGLALSAFGYCYAAAAIALGAALFFLEMSEAPIWAVPIDVSPQLCQLCQRHHDDRGGPRGVHLAGRVRRDLRPHRQLQAAVPGLDRSARRRHRAFLRHASRPRGHRGEHLVPRHAKMPSRLEVPS